VLIMYAPHPSSLSVSIVAVVNVPIVFIRHGRQPGGASGV
jgi:hypothetical protein